MNARRLERLEGEAFVRRWKAEGRFEKHLATLPEEPRGRPTAAKMMFPYPGHRHCGEWR